MGSGHVTCDLHGWRMRDASPADNRVIRSILTYVAETRLTNWSDTIGGHTIVPTHAASDDRDNLRQIAYPSGQAVRYEYDLDNRITRVYEAGSQANYASNVTYHPLGGVAQFVAGHGLTRTIDYDVRSRPGHVHL